MKSDHHDSDVRETPSQGCQKYDLNCALSLHYLSIQHVSTLIFSYGTREQHVFVLVFIGMHLASPVVGSDAWHMSYNCCSTYYLNYTFI